MIRPARDEEMQDVLDRMTAMEPWTRLGILSDELRRGLVSDSLRRLAVYEADDQICGAVIYRVKHAAEMLFFRGFGSQMASRFGIDYPCAWGDVPDGGYIGSLAVFDGMQGRGIGQKIVDAVNREFKEEGCRWSYLMVSGFNAPARKFYEKLGYREIGKVENCLKAGNVEHLMELDLEAT